MSRFLMNLAARFPLVILHALGALLGWAMYGLSPTYRRHLRANLMQAGFRDARTRRAAIASAGRMVTELPAVWLRPRTEAVALVRRIEGAEQVLAAHAAGKGIAFFTPHLGCFEIAARSAAEHLPITALYRPPKMTWLQRMIERDRAGYNLHLARADLSGVRELLAALTRREAVGILPDQVPGQGEGEWVEFFGRAAYTMTLGGKFVERSGVASFVAYGERLPHGQGYAVHIRPLPDAMPGERGVQRLNRAIEALIRECPGQYLWGYNRYKVPAGAEGPA